MGVWEWGEGARAPGEGGGAQSTRTGLRDAKAFKQVTKLACWHLEARRPVRPARCRG